MIQVLHVLPLVSDCSAHLQRPCRLCSAKLISTAGLYRPNLNFLAFSNVLEYYCVGLLRKHTSEELELQLHLACSCATDVYGNLMR